MGNKLALGYAYFAAYVLNPIFSWLRRSWRGARLVTYLEQHIFVNLDLPDPKWRVLDVFDAITPFYASTHTAQEVMSWFTKANCHNVLPRPWGSTAFAGTKDGRS
jgi:hypothetical protein